jgi:hypothetical protein
VIYSAGSRTTGQSAQNILIAGPSWRGAVPAGMKLVKSPTNMVFVRDDIAGRAVSVMDAVRP